jgi:Protein of unknown function (DUF3311)
LQCVEREEPAILLGSGAIFFLDWRHARAIVSRESRNEIVLGKKTMDPQAEKRGWSWWYLLFVLQFVAVLWPAFYNTVEPSWAGIPFFYWYQMLWVAIGAVLTAIVYFATEA